jgi:hypothetical protein
MNDEEHEVQFPENMHELVERWNQIDQELREKWERENRPSWEDEDLDVSERNAMYKAYVERVMREEWGEEPKWSDEANGGCLTMIAIWSAVLIALALGCMA